MITSPILEDKWKVQKLLSEQAGHDPSRYIALLHKKAVETQERYGIRFRYAEAEATTMSLDPIAEELTSASDVKE